jgi:hypothetical protein
MSVSAFNIFTESEAAEILEHNKGLLPATISNKHRVGFTLPPAALQKLSDALNLSLENPRATSTLVRRRSQTRIWSI